MINIFIISFKIPNKLYYLDLVMSRMKLSIVYLMIYGPHTKGKWSNQAKSEE